jgi:hypothetical protein
MGWALPWPFETLVIISGYFSPLFLTHCVVVEFLFERVHPSLLHQLLSLEALGRSSSKVFWLVTLGGCRLLYGLVAPQCRPFQEDVGEAWFLFVRGLDLALPEW